MCIKLFINVADNNNCNECHISKTHVTITFSISFQTCSCSTRQSASLKIKTSTLLIQSFRFFEFPQCFDT